MVYVPGFGSLESQGPNHVEYAEDMYENGNKIGIMDKQKQYGIRPSLVPYRYSVSFSNASLKIS